jgi:hypothetical protein
MAHLSPCDQPVDLGITDSFTSDWHFEQADFRILLKD